MKTLLIATTVAAALVGFAVPAQAAPDDDQIFYLWTVANGLHLSKTEASSQGAAVCAVLGTGTSLTSLAYQVMDMHPDWSVNDAGRFIGAAAESYCPEDHYT